MFEAHSLVKDFQIARRDPGFVGALSALVHPQVEVIRAVDEINFALDLGEIVGLLGPNGSGKSTIIKMLTGILEPTAGWVRFEGRSPHSDRRWFSLQIGAVFGQRTQLWWELPVRESFAVVRALYGIPDDSFHRTLNELVDELDLGPILQVPVRQLSLGQKMRAELCAAMLHRPRVLFLDEPTLGLDLEARDAFHRVLLAAKQRYGTSVVLTTHDAADIDALCDRIVVVCAGHVAYEGSVAVAKARVVPSETLICRVRPRKVALPNDEQIVGLDVACDGDQVTLTFDRARISQKKALAWLGSRWEIISHTPLELSTSGLLLEIYRAARERPT